MATLLLVAAGPEPRWATRAGWVWLLMTPALPLGMVACLVATARPADLGRWRLSGWWTFWLATLVSALLRPW